MVKHHHHPKAEDGDEERKRGHFWWACIKIILSKEPVIMNFKFQFNPQTSTKRYASPFTLDRNDEDEEINIHKHTQHTTLKIHQRSKCIMLNTPLSHFYCLIYNFFSISNVCFFHTHLVYSIKMQSIWRATIETSSFRWVQINLFSLLESINIRYTTIYFGLWWWLRWIQCIIFFFFVRIVYWRSHLLSFQPIIIICFNFNLQCYDANTSIRKCRENMRWAIRIFLIQQIVNFRPFFPYYSNNFFRKSN